MRVVIQASGGRVGIVVGYGPGLKGSPRAIVLFPDGTFSDFSLGEIRASELGRKTRRKILRKLGFAPDQVSQVTKSAH